MTNEETIIDLLRDIRALLQKQVAPIVALEIEQLTKATPEQRKAHNKEVLRQAKLRGRQ
jgi:hypothetical protein